MTCKWRSLAGVIGVMLAGCAASEPYRAPDVGNPSAATIAARKRAAKLIAQQRLGNERDEEVGVSMERGYLNQNDVNDVLADHTAQLTACYDRAGGARHYAAGEVKLRFVVSRTGSVEDVIVVGNQLGNYAVERCLVTEGRRIPFPKPGGNSDADFEYSLEFRSTRQSPVVDWQPAAVRARVAGRLSSLNQCGSPSEGPVEAVAYIKPNGTIASVGLSSPEPLEAMAAMCVVEQIRKWRLPGDKGHLIRTSFSVYGGTAKYANDHGAPLGPTARLRTAPRPNP